MGGENKYITNRTATPLCGFSNSFRPYSDTSVLSAE